MRNPIVVVIIPFKSTKVSYFFLVFSFLELLCHQIQEEIGRIYIISSFVLN